MRLRRLVVWGSLALAAAVLPLLESCGFSARIDVIQSFYDRSEFITAARCGEGPQTVHLIYALLSGEGRLMTQNDPLFAGGGAAAISVETPDPFTITGQAQTVTASVTANAFVEITPPTLGRGVAMVMDNSSSLTGFNELTGARDIPVTDPFDDRIAGAQNFVNNGLLSSDRATLIAFHGEGATGVDPKLRANPGDAPSASWFTANTSLLSEKLAELKDEETGKTPLYDAVSVGAQALRVLPGSLRPVMLLFSDGPDNSSTSATFTQAVEAVNAAPAIPVIAIGLGSLLDGDGEARLVDITCATNPQGVYLKAAQGQELGTRFDQARLLLSGYWKATLNLSLPGGLASGTYTVTGKLFADPASQPKQCDTTQTPPCPQGMACDAGRNRCYMNATFTVTVP